MPSVPSIPDLPESLTEREFWSLAGDMEHEKLDFKKGADYLKDVIPAMAMTDGGIILLGVAEDRSLTGRSLTQKIHDTVKRSGNGCGVDVGVKEIDVDGIKLTVVEVPAVTGRVVTTTDGRLLHRVGSDSQPLVGDALARFVRERDSKPSEEAALDRFVPADFDLGLINSALRSAARPQARRNSILRGLRDLRLTDRSADGEEHHRRRRDLVRYEPNHLCQRRCGPGGAEGGSQQRTRPDLPPSACRGTDRRGPRPGARACSCEH